MRQLTPYIFGLLLLTTSCGQTSNKTATTATVDSNAVKTTRTDSISISTGKPKNKSKRQYVSPNGKGIRKYISDEHYFHWTTLHADTTQYLCELTFHEEYALYGYHGQCAYYYFTYLTSDSTVDLLWSYKTDCILNMNFLEKSNGVKMFPKRGDTFATYTLTNDTTLQVKYNFPEWAKKINEITRDSIFPIYFHLDKQNSF